MRMDERRERRQKTVGVRFPVNPANDLLIGQSVRREKLVPQGNIPLEDTVNEVAPQRRAAALVAENVAQRRYVFHDFAAAAPARIGTRAEDAGHAFAPAEQGPRSAQQVRFGFDMLRTETFGQRPDHLRRRVGKRTSAPCAVKIDGFGRAAGRKFRKGFAYLLRRVLHGVDSPRAHLAGMHAVGEQPGAFGRSAVGNNFHTILFLLNSSEPPAACKRKSGVRKPRRHIGRRTEFDGRHRKFGGREQDRR